MPATADPRPVQILLIEDSPDDADLMVAALEESNLAIRVTVIEDGEAAMDYLRRRNEYEKAARPDLILLDLHLPRKNGFEVLAEVKQDAGLRSIPVIILTSSDNENTILTAYDGHANCYVTKPVDQEEFAQAVLKIERYWLHFAQRVRSSGKQTEE